MPLIAPIAFGYIKSAMSSSTSFWQRHRSRVVGSLGLVINLLYWGRGYLEHGPNLFTTYLARDFSHDVWLYIGLLLLIPIFIALGVTIQRAEHERERFKTLFDAARDGIYVRDAAGTIKLANPKFLEIHGLKSEDVIGKRSLELLVLTPQERQRLAQEVRQAILRGEPPTQLFEAPFRRPDGTTGWLQINVAFLKEEGQVKEVLGIIRDITERKRLELELIGQNRVLELLARGAPLPQVLEALCQIIEEQAPGTLCSVLLLENEQLRHGAAPSLPESYNQAVDGLRIGPNVGSCGSAASRKELVIVADTFSDPLWADFRDLAKQYGLRACWSMPITAQDGTVLGTFAMYYREPHRPSPDELQITQQAARMATIAIEHWRTIENIRLSEERYRLLFEHNLAGVFRATLDGRILDCNEAFARTMGCASRAEMLEEHALNFYFDPADREAYLQQLQAKGSVANYELRMRRKDGSPVWILENVNLIRESGAATPIIQGTIIDITERKRAETALQRSQEQLRASEERYRDLVEHANDAIYTLDGYGRFTSFNRKAEEVTGYKLGEVLGRPYTMLIPETERHKARRAFVKNLRGEASMTELTITRKDGQTAIVELSSRPVWREGRVSGIQGIARDITEKKALERLQQEFVSTVSHELRTPLTSIKGYVDLVLAGDTGPLTPDQEEFLRIVAQNTTRLTGLINDLLDMQRLETGRVEFELGEVALSELLRELAQAMRLQAAEKGLSFNVEVEPALKVRGDRERLAQVFNNLLSNAIKYTSAGGVTLRARRMGHAVAVSVSDTGIGLSEKDLQKLFQKFYRSDNPYVRKVGGTGLGLAISKAILERHGGTIAVASQPDQGSTFTVRLPVPALATPLARPTVLVIDDELAIAKLIAKYIERMNYHAETACTANDGFAKAVQLKPQLITLDVLMPDMDGFTLIQKLKSHPETAPIPVIFLSIVQDRLQGLRLGASAYLTKPIDEQKFSETVRNLLDPQGQPVLVVDDDPDFAKLLQRLLQREGWHAEIAHDGEEALAKLRAKPYQLVLLDKHMPKRSGLEVLQELRNQKALAHVPVILMSGSDQAVAQSVEILGAKRFLSKKLSPQALVQEIVAFLEKGSERADKNI